MLSAVKVYAVSGDEVVAAQRRASLAKDNMVVGEAYTQALERLRKGEAQKAQETVGATLEKQRHMVEGRGRRTPASGGEHASLMRGSRCARAGKLGRPSPPKQKNPQSSDVEFCRRRTLEGHEQRVPA